MPPQTITIAHTHTMPSIPLPTPSQHPPPSKSPHSLSPNVEIHPITPSLLPSYRRLITTLLPIRYPDKFYAESTSSPLALCALWHPSSPSINSNNHISDRRSPRNALQNGSTIPSPTTPSPILIGGIQCRLEPNPPPPGSEEANRALYIQTLAVLSPYRRLGIGETLLEAVIAAALTEYSPKAEPSTSSSVATKENTDSSAGPITEIYAHVWESNTDALEWYTNRGFEVEDAVVEGYYRRLKPGGARVVRRRVGVGDWLAAEKTTKGKAGNGDEGECEEADERRQREDG